MGRERKITELEQVNFSSDMIDNCFFVKDLNAPHLQAVKLKSIFDWIESEAMKHGLTVELKDDRIIFLSKSDKIVLK